MHCRGLVRLIKRNRRLTSLEQQNVLKTERRITGRNPGLLSKSCVFPDLQYTSIYPALRASQRLFTKTDGFSFEHHVFCDGPEGESQGCDE